MRPTEHSFVAGDRLYSINEVPTDDIRHTDITITLDGRRQWHFSAKGWRRLSVGYNGSTPYLWTARSVVVLPRSAKDEPSVIPVEDEDVLYVFSTEGGWLLVCETSLRLFRNEVEVARAEFGEVLMHASFDRGSLTLVDMGSASYRFLVGAQSLTDVTNNPAV